MCWPRCYSIPEILLKWEIICSSGLEKGKHIYSFPVLQSTCVLSCEGSSGLSCSTEGMNSQHRAQLSPELLPQEGTASPGLNRGKRIWNNLWITKRSCPAAVRKLSLPSALSQPRAVVWGALSAQQGQSEQGLHPQESPHNTTPGARALAQAPPLILLLHILLLHPSLQGLTQLRFPDCTWTFSDSYWN